MSEYTREGWRDLYEKTLNWQKTRRQTAGHKAKKASKKHKSATEMKPDKELKRLAKISAKRDVKNSIAKNLFNKPFSDLNEVERKKVAARVKENIFKQAVTKKTQEKFLEKKIKQKEKLEKQVEKSSKEEQKRKESTKKSEEEKSKELTKDKESKTKAETEAQTAKKGETKKKSEETSKEIEGKRKSEKKAEEAKKEELVKKAKKKEDD